MPVTDAQHKADPDRLISAILSSALWLIKGGGSAERLQELLVFCFFCCFFFLSANGGDDCAPQLRHKLIREIEEVAGGRIVRSLRLLLY